MQKQRVLSVATGLVLAIWVSACASASHGLPVGPTASTANNVVATGAAGCVNAYYPVSLGASWSYSSTGSGHNADYTFTRTISVLSAGSFTSRDAYSTGGNWSIQWNCLDGNLAALDAGLGNASLSSSKVNTAGTTASAEGFNIPALIESGKTWSEKVSIKSPLESNGKKIGDSQIDTMLDCTAGPAAEVTVPAGKFETVTVTCNRTVTVSAVAPSGTVPLGVDHENVTYWYARDVGLVKWQAGGGTHNEIVVLTSYQLPH